MKVLIIGMGYAGNRYRRALTELRSEFDVLEVAYVSRSLKPCPEPGYTNVARALREFRPDMVIVTVNDVYRAEVLAELTEYHGPIVCEKPLVTTADDLEEIAARFEGREGFYVSQIERYSRAAIHLKQFVRGQALEVVRCSFFWAKNRIGDPRPTSGVISEVIHPIDLIQWIVADGRSPVEQVGSHVVASDFSISGDEVVDTALVTGRLAGAAVAGYSSFVGLERMRTVQFVLSDGSPALIYATATFDSHEWDADQLRIWRLMEHGEQAVITSQDYPPEQHPGRVGLRKQVLLCRDLLNHLTDRMHRPDLPGIAEALRTQRVLNALAAGTGPTTQYFARSARFRLAADASAEVLG